MVNGYPGTEGIKPDALLQMPKKDISFVSLGISPFEIPASNASLDENFFDEELPFEIRPGYDVFGSYSSDKTPGYLHRPIKIISKSLEPEIFRDKSKPITKQELYSAVRTVCSGLMGPTLKKAEFEVNKDPRRKKEFIKEAYEAITKTLEKAMGFGSDCIISGMNYNAREGCLVVEFIANGGAIGSYYKHSI